MICIHARAGAADAGSSAGQVHAGSENFSFPSLRRHPDLGIRMMSRLVIKRGRRRGGRRLRGRDAAQVIPG